MYRRDYILRLIERFARALIAIRNRLLKRAADAADARAEIHEIARTSGIDLEIAKQLDPVTLLVWLAPGDDVDEAKLWLTAELLYLDALHARQRGTGDRGHGDLARALAVFRRLSPDWRPHGDLPSAGERAGEIEALRAQPGSGPANVDSGVN